MSSLGPMELIIILAIVVLVFGAGKLSDVGSALGKGLREFRREASVEPPAERTTAEPAVDGSVCPSCGGSVRQGQAFCGSCGTRVPTPAAQ
ncbi:MAG: twin-arginine translocase TatA/TatE family subunit [Chloroflexota bacterium]|nr:twin-arginine translocase TatA/TatE family subunit [Chloroflexota bacterium]